MSAAHSHDKPHADLKAEYEKFIGKKISVLFVFILAIIFLAGYAATRGSADISVTEVYATILASSCPAISRPTGSRIPSSGACGCIAFFWQ